MHPSPESFRDSRLLQGLYAWTLTLLSMTSLHRFCKPLDTVLVSQLAEEHPVMITVEEGAIGGFGSHGTPALVNASAHNSQPPDILLSFQSRREAAGCWG